MTLKPPKNQMSSHAMDLAVYTKSSSSPIYFAQIFHPLISQFWHSYPWFARQFNGTKNPEAQNPKIEPKP